MRMEREDDTEKFQLILEVIEKSCQQLNLSGHNSPGVLSTCNSHDSDCVGNMSSISDGGCGEVPTPEPVIRATLGLDDLRMFDEETQRQ